MPINPKYKGCIIHSDLVKERKYSYHQGGPPTTTELKPSLKLISNVVNNNIRTVVVSRAMKGLSNEYYTFDPSASATLPYISAVGNSETLSYHKNKAPNMLAVLPKGQRLPAR